jgi:hypothetical protein
MPFSVRTTALGVFLSSAVAMAQGPIVRPFGPLPPVTPATTTLTRAGQAGQSMIHGTAVDANTSPLPNAAVRLRNLQTNQIEQLSTANQLGEFSFVAQPEIPYVVEIADQAGNIVAVGDVITAQAGEVAGALVAIPTRLPALAGVFGETAGSVVSAATGTGLTALDATVAPFVSPER